MASFNDDVLTGPSALDGGSAVLRAGKDGKTTGKKPSKSGSSSAAASKASKDAASGSGKKKKKNKNSGGFQAMNLSQNILKGVLRKGYRLPTPIQRKAIPAAMMGKDVVAMARTGSGKVWRGFVFFGGNAVVFAPFRPVG